MTPPVLDHLVIDVRDRLPEAAAVFGGLGFQVTPLGRHSLGSANHLMIFPGAYLELLGTAEAGGALRPDIAAFPVGANGLVFRSDDAPALSPSLVARGVPALPASAFHRPVDLPDGTRDEARFRTVRLDPAAAFDGRLYWCEHLTPQHVWRPEWERHPNGALGISRVVLAVRDPARQAAMFRRIYGDAAVQPGPQGGLRVASGSAVVDFVPQAAVAAELGADAPDPAGRADHMALIEIRVADLGAVAIPGLAPAGGRLRIPAARAFNVTIDLVG